MDTTTQRLPTRAHFDLIRARAERVHLRWPRAELEDLLAVGEGTLARCIELADPSSADFTRDLSTAVARDLRKFARQISYTRNHVGIDVLLRDGSHYVTGGEDDLNGAIDALRADRRARAALATLTHRERTVVHLLYRERASLDEIATRLRVTEKTAWRVHHAAKERLERAVRRAA